MRSIGGEDPVAASKARQRAEQGYGHRGQGHFVGEADLVPGGGDREQGVVAVEARKLRPAGFRPIIAALRRSKQELNEDAEHAGIRRRMPYRFDFVFGENPLSPHHGACEAYRLVSKASSRRNLDTSVAVVGGEAEYTPHSIQRVAGRIRSSGTPDRVEAG
jgi:hypothetical protein